METNTQRGVVPGTVAGAGALAPAPQAAHKWLASVFYMGRLYCLQPLKNWER